ncbi:histamine H2 receptor-like [Orbicella faveolata]|uniref:histamine H2 receptor-like n=1 Tax=Orbicella faveolata TaxID=48498 RepID=UPI0009E3E867|nr:histamine H2 receptor-like [Orbicella faveolata]
METWFWILGWSLSILTIAGNGFIIFLVYSKRQLRTKTNAFVVSLAVADFCVGISVVPSMFFCEMANGCKRQFFWTRPPRLLFSYASVMNLYSLVVDRYIAVVKPFKYLTFMKRRRVIQMVSLSWAIPLAYGIVFSLYFFIFKNPHFRNSLFWVTVVFFELLPCFILIASFAFMLQVICKHERAARTRARQLRFNHHCVSFRIQEKSAVKIMAVVIGLFLLCYGFYIRCSFKIILKEKNCNDEEYKIPLLVLSSAINPVAYAFFKRDIKREIKRRIFCVIREA